MILLLRPHTYLPFLQFQLSFPLLVSFLFYIGEFVVTQKHPLEPPTQRDMTDRVFRPPGTVVPKALKELKSTKVVVAYPYH